MKNWGGWERFFWGGGGGGGVKDSFEEQNSPGGRLNTLIQYCQKREIYKTDSLLFYFKIL